MPFDPERPDLVLGVVGAGAMGRGIAQIAAVAGIRVLLLDADAEVSTQALEFIGRMLERAAAKGRMSTDAAQAARARIERVESAETLGECHVVVEAIVEQLEAKQMLLRELEIIVDRSCVLATNTSSLSVTAIASVVEHPGRVAGWHFFNPVPLMRLVEVVRAELTEPAIVEGLCALARRMGHEPVRALDTPGFVVNHAGRAFGTEALRIAGERIADWPDVDRVMREAAGFRMGPFELLDLTGLDVSHPVMESIYHQYYEEPRFRPSLITRRRMSAGVLGRKSGRGFYAYREGRRLDPEEPALPRRADVPVWVSPNEPQGHAVLCAALERAGAEIESGPQPSARALCLVTPLGDDATTTALGQELDPVRTLAVDTLLGLDRRRTLMSTPVTAPAYRDTAHALLGSDGRGITLIHDSPGFIAQRILAMIVNTACEMAQQGVAVPADIDRSVEVGLGYPHGPLAFGDRLEPVRILRILEAMHRFYGDPRYRPSPWLIRRARLGVSLLTEER